MNKRRLSHTERVTAAVMFLITLFVVAMILLGIILVVLYLLKSWLGIDIFANESLGLWDQFKELFM